MTSEYLLNTGENLWDKLVETHSQGRMLHNMLDMCLRDVLPPLTAITDMSMAVAIHGTELVHSTVSSCVTHSVRYVKRTSLVLPWNVVCDYEYAVGQLVG